MAKSARSQAYRIARDLPNIEPNIEAAKAGYRKARAAGAGTAKRIARRKVQAKVNGKLNRAMRKIGPQERTSPEGADSSAVRQQGGRSAAWQIPGPSAS